MAAKSQACPGASDQSVVRLERAFTAGAAAGRAHRWRVTCGECSGPAQGIALGAP